MAEPSGTWWLRAGETIARRITPAGIVLGRSPHCEIVLDSNQASRRHALVYLGARGPRLVVLGRGPTTVSGAPVDGEAELANGVRLGVPGLELEVQHDPGATPRIQPRAPVWVLSNPSGGYFGMARFPFLVGGSAEDDLRVEAWPPGALCFRVTDTGRLQLEVSAPVAIDGEPIEGEGPHPLDRGAEIAMAGAAIRVITGGAFASGSTAAEESPPTGEVARAELEFLPRGGRLHLTVGSEVCSVYLADRRCNLIAVLLQPPDPHAPGDYIEDDVVIARVWGKSGATRTNLNVLLHRVRKDLDRAGLDGAAMIERREGGGATRFTLGEGAKVELG